jgi:hypothetical protein
LKDNRAVIPVDFTLWDNLSEGDRQAAQEGLFRTVVSCLKNYREVKAEFREVIPFEVERQLEHVHQSEAGAMLTWETDSGG